MSVVNVSEPSISPIDVNLVCVFGISEKFDVQYFNKSMRLWKNMKKKKKPHH